MNAKDFMCPTCETLVSVLKQQKIDSPTFMTKQINFLLLSCGHGFNIQEIGVCKKCKEPKPTMINSICTDCGGFTVKVRI